MTTIITRLYADEEAAKHAVSQLKEIGIIDRDLDLICHRVGLEGTPDRDALHKRIRDARVYATAAKIYTDHVAEGKALVVVRAPFKKGKPATDLLRSIGSIDAGVKYTELYVSQVSAKRGQPSRYRAGILTGGPKFLTGPVLPGTINQREFVSSLLGLKTVIQKKRKSLPLTKSRKPISAMFNIPLLIRGGKKSSTIKTATPFSSLFGLPLLVRRKS